VEWVQTTARTVEEAKELALDELGVDDREAEFEVLEEPRSGLFGLTRGEARVRARVRPTAPRPKQERKRRRGGSGGGSRQRSRGGGQAKQNGEEKPKRDGGSKPPPGGQRSRQRRPAARERQQEREQVVKGETMSEASAEEQAGAAEEFLEGVVEAFGLAASVTAEVGDEAVEVSIDGDDLGLLIGPKGRTLWALQELTKTVVQRQQGGGLNTRIRVDVAGYRERRKAALERFTKEAAAAVLESGVARALEPMGAADRKVIHDTVNEIDGVGTRSEGEDPRRRVVITPEDS
jgi:spoIIIJ-associated protein